MTFAEFAAAMRGVAIANGVKPGGEAPGEDEFYADLAAAVMRGEA